MLRRAFLGAAAASAAMPLGAAAVAAARRPAIDLPASYVTGTADGAAREVAPRLHPGAPLILRRAAHDPFDPRTIEVWHGPARLGRLPGDDSRLLAGLMDAGANLRATVLSVTARPDKPVIRLSLTLVLHA